MFYLESDFSEISPSSKIYFNILMYPSDFWLFLHVTGNICSKGCASGTKDT